MKKIFASVFGLALLATAIVPFTNASREAYHNYLYRQAREKTTRYVSPYPLRPFAQRRGTTRQLLQRDTTPNRRGELPIRNLRYSQENTRDTYSRPSTEEEKKAERLPFRPSTDRIALPWQERMQKRGEIVFEQIDNAVETFETYENQAFSLRVPEGWFPSYGEPHFFRSRKADFTISIERIEDACTNVSFTTCAIALSTDRNSETPAQKIINISSISRQSRYSDTILDQPNIQTRTFTESFAGQIREDQKYISRYFVAGTDGSVYLIETKTSLRNASRFIGVSKKIFDSFRIFPAEKSE